MKNFMEDKRNILTFIVIHFIEWFIVSGNDKDCFVKKTATSFEQTSSRDFKNKTQEIKIASR